MLQRIVVLRKKEELQEAARTRSIAPAQSMLAHQIQVRGLQFDDKYHPVSLPGLAATRDPGMARSTNYRDMYKASLGAAFGVRIVADDEEALQRLLHDRKDEVVGIYADPAISIFPAPYCGRAAVGKTSDVANKLGVRTLQRENLTGKKVRVAIVDTGVNGALIPVAGGWSPNPTYVPGTSPSAHGTMVAFDSRIAAPEAAILDYALLRSENDSWTAFLSDAITAYADLIDLLTRAPGALVVNNSWGMYNRADDAPIGSPENYSANLEHPFNQIIRTLVSMGADVFFAAGNCGAHCPDQRCGANDRGPGASIHGANSHPDVITVAAVTVNDRRLGYSSQGPGGLHQRKPDLAAYSHFAGSGVYPADTGTSAACPVAAGVAAALRQKFSPSKVPPAQLKGILQRTAIDLEGDGWDYDLGYGVINANAAWKNLAPAPQMAKVERTARARVA